MPRQRAVYHFFFSPPPVPPCFTGKNNYLLKASRSRLKKSKRHPCVSTSLRYFFTSTSLPSHPAADGLFHSFQQPFFPFPPKLHAFALKPQKSSIRMHCTFRYCFHFPYSETHCHLRQTSLFSQKVTPHTTRNSESRRYIQEPVDSQYEKHLRHKNPNGQ